MKKSFWLGLLSLSVLSVSAQNEGDNFFGAPQVHEIRLTFAQTNYWDSLVDGYTNDYYIKGDIEIDGTLLTNCGIKFKGNSSYNNPSDKKSFKLDLNEYVAGQDYDGLKKLNLNNGFKDPTFLREKIMLDYLLLHNLPAPRCTYVNLYINNQLWGLYTGIEEADVKPFLRRWFQDDRGNLFKGDPSGDMKWLGSSPSAYFAKYELKTNETLNDWTDLVTFLDKMNNTPIADLKDTLDNLFNTSEYIKTWASHILFSNLDSYPGSGHNYFLYNDSLSEKFRFVSWDVNEAFGNFSMGMTPSQMETLSAFYVPSPAGSRPLHERMLQVPEYEQEYIDVLCQMIDFEFSIWALEAKIDSLSDVIRPYVYADTKKFYSNTAFETNLTSTVTVPGPGNSGVPGLKNFLINRRNAIAAELASMGCTVGIEDMTEDQAPLIYPNPASDHLQIDHPLSHEIDYLIYDITGKLVISGNLKNSTIIDLSPLGDQGCYFIQLNNSVTNSSSTVKFLKI